MTKGLPVHPDSRLPMGKAPPVPAAAKAAVTWLPSFSGVDQRCDACGETIAASTRFWQSSVAHFSAGKSRRIHDECPLPAEWADG